MRTKYMFRVGPLVSHRKVRITRHWTLILGQMTHSRSKPYPSEQAPIRLHLTFGNLYKYAWTFWKDIPIDVGTRG
jgi:hypothetical protein